MAQVSKFIFAISVPALFSAIVIASILMVDNFITPAVFEKIAVSVFLADTLGVLLLYPLYIGWNQYQRKKEKLAINQTIITLTAIAIVLIMVLVGIQWAIFLLLPILVVYSGNSALLHSALLNLVSVILLVILCSSDLGPFDQGDSYSIYQQTMALSFAIAISLFAIAIQRRQLSLAQVSQQKWKSSALTDPLSKLENRRSFDQQLIYHCQRQHCIIALIDIDNFKSINDTFGHSKGDEVIAALGDLLNTHLRQEDRSFRVGGEEFAVLFEFNNLTLSTAILDRLRVAFTKLPLLDNCLSFSAGIAKQTDNESAKAIYARADQALYRAKNSGKNQIIVAE